jgi:hypothetical protein
MPSSTTSTSTSTSSPFVTAPTAVQGDDKYGGHTMDWYNRSGMGHRVKGTIDSTGNPEHIGKFTLFFNVSFFLFF